MIDVSKLNEEERQALVCLYFARMPGTDPRYEARKEYWEVLSRRYARKWTDYNEGRRALDPYFSQKNGRNIWKDKPLEKKSRLLKEILDRYGDAEDPELEAAADAVIERCRKELQEGSFIAFRVKYGETVDMIRNSSGEDEIIIDRLNVLSGKLKAGTVIFIVFAKDTRKGAVTDWETGFCALAHVCRGPFDMGYAKTDGGKDLFKIGIRVDVKFGPIAREEFRDYPDTYDACYISVGPHRDPEQTMASLEDCKAAAVIRAVLDRKPELKSSFEAVFSPEFMSRVCGSVTRLIPVPMSYGQTVEEGMAEDLRERKSLRIEKEEEDLASAGWEAYTEEDFLKDVFLSREDYDLLRYITLGKKNVILQGAPGVGKTYMARRLAYSIMGVKDESRVEMVQFHQNYTYEEFVCGYQPTETGFELRYGPFYRFCRKASRSRQPHFFIIDEINRGNISKIFGELLMLIESDKRGQKLKLLYSEDGGEEEFCVPDNLYIIGLMNTADRSLAIIDYALRRRFAFFDIHPAFDSEGFQEMMKPYGDTALPELVETVKELNRDIRADESLGEGFEIGHSYFCVPEGTEVDDMWIRSVIEYSIIPLIREYWFDNPDQVGKWTGRLRRLEHSGAEHG